MADTYHCRPSNLIDVTDPYEAYCFDEACVFILSKLRSGEEPMFETEQKHYTSFKALYKQYEK